MFSDYFSIALFFVIFRETLEITIILSVLLAFIDRLSLPDASILKSMRRMVWLGTLSATVIVVAIGSALISIWYRLGMNAFESSELLYEGIFGLIASVFLTVTAFAFLKGQHLYDKMTTKLESKFEDQEQSAVSPSTPVGQIEDGLTMIESDKDSGSKDKESVSGMNVMVDKKDTKSFPVYKMHSSQVFFWVPFITVVREGIETVMLIGGNSYSNQGVSFSEAQSSIPLAAVAAIVLGCLAGLIIHRAAGKLSLRWFFVAASYLLLLMSSGIFSRSIGFLEDNTWRNIVGESEGEEMFLKGAWEKTSAGYGFLFSILGYRSVASIGTITSYIAYWAAIVLVLVAMKWRLSRATRSSLSTE